MSTLDYEAEYNNRARVANSAEIIARWAKASAAARSELAAELDVPYGHHARQRYDYFSASVSPVAGPLAVYIHGGYWQRGQASDYAFVARELLARGVSVALPSYRLCPDATIADIINDLRLFMVQLWRKTSRRPVIVGHSAGAHLAACLMAGGGAGADDCPADLVQTAYGLSGVYDLAPLIGTSINQAIGLDAATAHAVSPLFWPAPRGGCTFVAAAGGNESSEFKRQALDLVPAWQGQGAKIEATIIDGADHFTIVDELCRPGSALLERVVGMARSVA